MRRLWVIISLFCALGATFPLAAQFLTQDVPLNGARISIPADWVVEPDPEFGGQIATAGALSLTIFDPVVVGDLIDVADDATASEVVGDLADVVGIDASPSQILVYEDTIRPSAIVYYDEPVQGALIATRVRAGRFLAVKVQSNGQVIDKSLELVNRIINSYISDSTMTPGMVINEPTAVISPVEVAESCFVAQADGATLRVGPGLNRSSIAFLTTTTPVTVTGRFIAEDSVVWYQLDRSQAAPQSAANELWVTADEVETTGDCQTIGEVAAPPIVRASNPPPAQPTQAPAAAESSENTLAAGEPPAQPTAEPAQPEQPAPAGFQVPRSGIWLVSLNANTDISCQGTGNVVISSLELWDELTFTGSLTARIDGASLNIDGDTFVFAPPDLYVGSYTNDDGSNTQLYLNIQSPTFITGRATINVMVDNVPCSGTTGLTVTRQ